MLAFFFFFFKCGEFLPHIPYGLHFYVGSFSYTSRAGLIFLWGVLLHIPYWLHFYVWSFLHFLNWFHFYAGSFSYTSRAGFFSSSFYLGSFSYTSRAGFIFRWGISLTHPMLVWFFWGEFLLHIPCWLHIYSGSFSYTSHACFLFLWGVCLTHPELVLSLSLSLPLGWLHFYAGSFSYTSRAGFFLFLSFWGVSLTHHALALFFYGEFFLHIPCLFDFSVGSFSYTSHAGFFFWGGGGGSFSNTSRAGFFFFFLSGSFSYTSRAGFIFLWGVSLTHPMLVRCFCGEFLLQIPRWLFFLFFFFLFFSFFFFLLLFSFFFNLGSFSYTSRASFIFMRQVYLTHPVLALFLCGSFSYTSQACFLFLLGVCLTHPEFFVFFLSLSLSSEMASLLCGVFLLHIPCWLLLFYLFLSGSLLHIRRWLYFSVGSFSYTSHACFIFMWGVSLTHPMLASSSSSFFCFLVLICGISLTHLVLASYLCGEFLLQIPYWLYFYLGSFSYTSHACFLFLWGVCLTHP